jgi:ribosome-associated protein
LGYFPSKFLAIFAINLIVLIEKTSQILDSELVFQSSRSSGPGGQHVNKVESRIELFFQVKNSQILSENQKELILAKLSSKLSADGTLRVVAQNERSQLKNKQLAIRKFYELIGACLKPTQPRVATKPSKSADEKRILIKKQRSLLKNYRKKFSF